MIKIWAKHVIDSCNKGHIEISEDGVTSSFIHPGMHYGHFDRDGNPNIADVMQFVNDIRNVSLFSHTGPNGTNHLDYIELLKGRLNFVMSSHIEMTRDFYDRLIPKWPVKAAVSLSYLGNSSLTIMVKVSVPDRDIPLITLRSSYALVDRDTRKSKPFPDWYKSKYGGKGLHAEPCRVETLIKPSETFHSQLKVVWTDTDRNNHTNFSSYVKFTIDSLRSALRLQTLQQHKRSEKLDDSNSQNTLTPQLQHATVTFSTSPESSDLNTFHGLRGINQDIVKSGLKSVRICYTNESVEGDVIDVFLWQEEGDDLRVKAVLERGGDTLCHIHLEYYGTVTSNL